MNGLFDIDEQRVDQTIGGGARNIGQVGNRQARTAQPLETFVLLGDLFGIDLVENRSGRLGQLAIADVLRAAGNDALGEMRMVVHRPKDRRHGLGSRKDQRQRCAPEHRANRPVNLHGVLPGTDLLGLVSLYAASRFALVMEFGGCLGDIVGGPRRGDIYRMAVGHDAQQAPAVLSDSQHIGRLREGDGAHQRLHVIAIGDLDLAFETVGQAEHRRVDRVRENRHGAGHMRPQFIVLDHRGDMLLDEGDLGLGDRCGL